MGAWQPITCALLLELLLAGEARAQYGAEAEVEAPIPAGSDVDPTAAATVVEPDARPGALETAEELLLEVPGARVRSLGGVGSFAGLSLRGAELEQTAVLLGDVPIGSEGHAFDLSLVPVALLDRIEVYRGGAPLRIGEAAPGGVLRLVPRSGRTTFGEASIGAGSFGRWEGRAAAAVAPPGRALSWTAVAGLRHSDGDFPFDDDGGTPFDPADDVERRRQNGRVDETFGLARLRAGELDAVVIGQGRTGGLAGSPVEEPTRARRRSSRGLAALRWSRSRPRWNAGVTTAADLERQELTDLYREVGVVPRATDDRTRRLFLRADGAVTPAPFVELAALATYRVAHHAPSDRLAAQPNGSSVRHVATTGAELVLRGRGSCRRPPSHRDRAAPSTAAPTSVPFGGAGGCDQEHHRVRAELRLAGRIELSETRLVETREERAGQRRRATEVAPGARVALVVEPLRAVALSASVATATRLPSLVELFGDRGYLLGDTRLRPERSLAVDAGAVVAGRAGIVRGAVEARGFALFTDDLIRYVRTAALQVVPQNVASARAAGVEVGVRGTAGRHVGLASALTFMATEDGSLARELPLRPRIQAYARPELRLGPYGPVDSIVVWGDVTHVGRNFVDPQSLVRVPARTLIGAGLAVELLERRIRIEASGADLGDERPFDLVGFPLPGRRFAVEVTVRAEDP